MAELLIEASNLTKRFGSREALRGIALQVRAGEVYGLVGPDGAGKTTTLRLLAGILAPSGGQIRVAGLDVVRRPEKVKTLVGYMPQRFALYEDLTVQENLDFFADLYGVGAAVRQERATQLLAASRMEPFRARRAGQLSGGMKQKLALACTLVHRPRLLLLDEPTTGVDPVSRREFWHLLHGFLAEGVTIVYSTPYMDEAERCTTITFLSQGQIVACASPRALKARMDLAILELVAEPGRVARQVAAAVPGVEEVQAFGERLHLAVADALAVEEQLRARLAAAGVRLVYLRPIPPSLEDVFMRLRSMDGGASQHG